MEKRSRWFLGAAATWLVSVSPVRADLFVSGDCNIVGNKADGVC